MQQVVGAAIIRAGRALAARRTAPSHAAGRWEFPGGKVEPGETPGSALVREIREELGCQIEVTGWFADAVAIGSTHVLTVATARLVAGDPAPTEHDALVWLSAEELGGLDWLDADRPFLPELAAALGRPGASRMGAVRGIFFDEADARAVVARLLADGYDATSSRERLAGEDDDEDHPWAVTTDAPEPVLDLLVDTYDGWLDTEDVGDGPAAAPLDLPSNPLRIKRPPQ